MPYAGCSSVYVWFGGLIWVSRITGRHPTPEELPEGKLVMVRDGNRNKWAHVCVVPADVGRNFNWPCRRTDTPVGASVSTGSDGLASHRRFASSTIADATSGLREARFIGAPGA